MNEYYTKVEDWMKRTYDASAPRYRENDEVDALGPDHCRVCKTLEEICLSFDHPISVLDVGCGTGRYFHCLRRVDRLVGIDVSTEMLALARNPVKADEVTARSIELMVGNAYVMDFPEGSFDLIFSLGVFGNGCPVEAKICGKFLRWLRSGGKLFFDSFDIMDIPFLQRSKIRARQFVYAHLPPAWQRRWDQRSGWLPFYALSRRQLINLLLRTGFREVHVESHLCSLDIGTGRKLEALARR